ncbi:MAG: LysR family transcriptional regulator [Casimicrobiaceae bacterium]
MDIKKTDLNVLMVFAAMLEHGNVTRAGIALGLSQPAMSAALKKLRTQLGDPLFVRGGHGMRPTPRALQAAGPVKRVLAAVKTEILQAPAFDPATATRSFTIITPDIGEVVFLPKLLAYAVRHAPDIDFRSLPIPSPGAGDALEAGVADLAIGYFPDLARPGFYQQRLFRNAFVCILRNDHPQIGSQLTMEAFLRASHAVVRPAGRTHVFDAFLEKRRIRRRVRVEIAHFASLLTIVAESDLIATVPSDIGEVFSRMAKIRLLPPPIQPPRFDVKQHWHGRVHVDAANRWLRKSLRELTHD